MYEIFNLAHISKYVVKLKEFEVRKFSLTLQKYFVRKFSSVNKNLLKISISFTLYLHTNSLESSKIILLYYETCFFLFILFIS